MVVKPRSGWDREAPIVEAGVEAVGGLIVDGCEVIPIEAGEMEGKMVDGVAGDEGDVEGMRMVSATEIERMEVVGQVGSNGEWDKGVGQMVDETVEYVGQIATTRLMANVVGDGQLVEKRWKRRARIAKTEMEDANLRGIRATKKKNLEEGQPGPLKKAARYEGRDIKISRDMSATNEVMAAVAEQPHQSQ